MIAACWGPLTGRFGPFGVGLRSFDCFAIVVWLGTKVPQTGPKARSESPKGVLELWTYVVLSGVGGGSGIWQIRGHRR